MLCQHCNEKQATSHYKSIINGVKKEGYFCEDCAAELGLDNFIKPIELTFGNMLGNFLGATSSVPTSLAGVRRCPQCGSSYNEIVSSGQVGCATCYDMFKELLIPSIENIHGKAVHKGKVAKDATIHVKVELSEGEKLKKALAKAIERQDFELAAKLRDKIKELDEDQKTDEE